MLNEDEQRATQHQTALRHAEQLDAILQQIQAIEAHEDALLERGLALGYATPKQLDFVQLQNNGQASVVVSTEPLARSPRPASRANETESLVLPLGVVMAIDVPALEATQEIATAETHTEPQVALSAETFKSPPSPSRHPRPLAVSTSILHGRRYLAIEKRRQKFERHRELVESSLAGTGMRQCAVIELYVSPSRA